MSNLKQDKTFYVRDILTIVWKRKWLILIPVVLVTAITAYSSTRMTPVYESSVTIFMDKPVRLSQDLQRITGQQPVTNSEAIQREMQSIQNEVISAPYIRQLVENLGLDKEPGIEVTARRIQAQQPNVSLEDLKFDLLLNSIRNRIRVQMAGLNQVRIIVESAQPDRAKAIAENLGNIFIQEKAKQESRTISASSDFSSDQLATYEQDLQTKITAKTDLEKERVQVQLDDVVASEDNRRQINLEIQGVAIETSELEKQIKNIEARLTVLEASRVLPGESELLKSKKTEINNLLSSMSELMKKYSWNAPSLVTFKLRLYALASDVDEGIAQVVRQAYPLDSETSKNELITLLSSRARLETLNSYSTNLKTALAELNKRVSLMPEYSARIEQLDREIDALRNLRDQFKLSQEGTQISQALLLESKYRVIEPARLPLSPIKPDKRMIVLLGFFVGATLGAGAVVIAEFFDNSFKKIEDAENTLGFAVIGTMPRIEGLDKLKTSAGR